MVAQGLGLCVDFVHPHQNYMKKTYIMFLFILETKFLGSREILAGTTD
jgi:hypothetical protein